MTVKLHIRLSSGVKFSTDFAGSTVLQCKEWLHSEHSCPIPSLQRLIYKGRILNDKDSFETLGIGHGCTLFLVTVKENNNNNSKPPAVPKATPSNNTFTASTPSDSSAPGSTTPNVFPPNMMSNMAGAAAPGSQPQANFGSQMEAAQQALNNPMFQNMLNNNPEFLTTMLQRQMESNPALRQLMESNPMIREVLNDPSSLRQMLQTATNPELRAQQQRQHDLALSQIENMPGGFNALRNLYESVQGPLEESMIPNNANESNNNNTTSTTGAEGASGTAMPNPWGSSSSTRNSNTTAPIDLTNEVGNPFGNMDPNLLSSMMAGAGNNNNNNAGGGSNNPFGNMDPNLLNSMMAGAGGMGAPSGSPQQQREAALQMLENNPNLQTMMQQTIQQNPAMIRNLIAQSNPMAASLVQNMDDAQLQQMMGMAMNPAALRSAMQMEQQLAGMGLNPSSMMGMMGGNTAAAAGAPNPWAAASGGGGLDFTGLLQQPPNGPSTTNTNNSSPWERYHRQLQQMADMGFDDEPRVLEALVQTHGHLNRAVDVLLTSPPSDQTPPSSQEEPKAPEDRKDD